MPSDIMSLPYPELPEPNARLAQQIFFDRPDNILFFRAEPERPITPRFLANSLQIWRKLLPNS